MRKPSDVFDRDWEWSRLTNFTAATRPVATLGVVSGRRRQGETYLLEALTEMTGGFMFAATEALPRAEALRQLARSIADFRGQPAPPHYGDWHTWSVWSASPGSSTPKEGRRASLLYSVMPQLRKAADDSGRRVQLVDLQRLYDGE